MPNHKKSTNCTNKGNSKNSNSKNSNSKENSKEQQIKNRGTGAGGANTNKNGLKYELETELFKSPIFLSRITLKNNNKHINEINIKGNNNTYIHIKKSNQLFKYMKDEMNKDIPQAHGCKQPDEAIINKTKNIIFIIEKKFQKCGGSVCEKIQTSQFKIWQYSRTFPKYKIVYIYCLSNWFKKNCIAELEYLKLKNVPVFWGNKTDYSIDLTNFIINYKL